MSVTHHPQPPQWQTPMFNTLMLLKLKALLPCSVLLLVLLFASALFAQHLESVSMKEVAVYRAWGETGTTLNVMTVPVALSGGTLKMLQDAAAKRELAIGKQFEPYVVVIVTINPEGRVKVEAGPWRVFYETGWYSPAIVKIINEAGLTSRLTVEASGDTLTTARLYEAAANINFPAITSQLCGAAVEYQALLLRSTGTGKREVTLSFQAGDGSQDLGFRAELPVLLTPRPSPRLPKFQRNPARFLTKDDMQRKQALEDLRDRFQLVAGSVVDRRSLSFNLRVVAEEQLGTIIRRKILYQNLDDTTQSAYLLLPRERPGRCAAVLCLHQTTRIGSAEPAGVGGLPNLHYALELAQRGFITLAPDYPGYGSNTTREHFPSTTGQAIMYHRRAVDLLCSLPEVDASRLGCIGHSLGGHNTLFLGLFDDRLKVLATSCGFCSFPQYYGGNLKGWSHGGYMPRIASIYQCDPKQMPWDFPELLAALAPRAVFINAPRKDDNFAVAGVRECVDAARPVFGDRLRVEYPDAGHDFPKDVRERCYVFMAKHLR